jgi:hypothetical protein
MAPRSSKALLTTRTALVLLLGTCSATAVGLLTALAGHHPATAVLAGLGTAAAATTFFHNHIAHDPPQYFDRPDRREHETNSPTKQTAHVIQNFNHNDQRLSDLAPTEHRNPSPQTSRADHVPGRGSQHLGHRSNRG